MVKDTKYYRNVVIDQSDNILEVTPSNTEDLPEFAVAIYIGTTGNLAVRNSRNQTVIMKGIVAGVWHPVRTTRILATNTTATDILIQY